MPLSGAYAVQDRETVKKEKLTPVFVFIFLSWPPLNVQGIGGHRKINLASRAKTGQCYE